LILVLTWLAAACSPAATPGPALSPEATPDATPTPVPAAPTPAPDTPTQEPAAASTATPAVEPTLPPTPEPAESAPETGSRPVQFVIVPEETTASYSIDEIFIDQNNTLATAVGRTSAVEGELMLDFEDPAASQFGQFRVDISTLTSDRSRRDNAIRRQWLESASYPLATFDVKEVRGFPAGAREGEPVEFELVGDMTIKETSREVTWDVTAVLEGDRLSGTATTFILLEDFDVPVPNIAGILRVTDGATVTLDFAMESQG
jgi:polyisoprenoid-binding protein YceI